MLIVFLYSVCSDPDPLRIQMVVFDNTPEFVATLLAFVAVPIPFRTNPDFNISILTSKNEGIFLNLKVYALKTLTKFISICSFEAANTYEDEEEASKRIAKECAECVVEGQGLEVLLNFLEVEETESVRLAIAEALFFFIVRNEMGRLAVVIQRGISTFLNCLDIETSAIIRSYYCAILREFGTVYPEELLKDNMIGIASKLLNIDPSPDVRALCAEILEVLFRSDPKALKFLEESKIDLPKILSDRLMQDQSREVLEAICKLLETMFSLKNKSFLNKFIQIGGWRAFVRVLKSCSVRPASLAVRALRYLLQNADYQVHLGKNIITHFPSLSVLLKAALDQEDKQQQKKHTIAHKLLKVELAICLGLIFSQDPSCRYHVYNELKAFPVWMATLRSALLKHLSLAEMEYFASINIVDFSGTNLIQSFTADTPDGPAVKSLFIDQESRHEQMVADGYFEQDSRKPDIKSIDATDETTWGKIKSYILSYAIHVTLCPPQPQSAPVTEDYSVSHHQANISSPSRQAPPFTQSPHSAEHEEEYEDYSRSSVPSTHANSPSHISLYNQQQRDLSPRTKSIHTNLRNQQPQNELYYSNGRSLPRTQSGNDLRVSLDPFSPRTESEQNKQDKPQRPRRQAIEEIIYTSPTDASHAFVQPATQHEQEFSIYDGYTSTVTKLRSDADLHDQFWHQHNQHLGDDDYIMTQQQQFLDEQNRLFQNIEDRQLHHEASLHQEQHPFDAPDQHHYDFQNAELQPNIEDQLYGNTTSRSHYSNATQDFDTQSIHSIHSIHSREGSEFDLQPRKNRQVTSSSNSTGHHQQIPYDHNEHNLAVQQPIHDTVESQHDHILKRKKKSPKKTLRQMQLENALFLPKKFGLYYVDEKMLKRKAVAQKQFLDTFRMTASPSNKVLKNYVSTGDGLVVRKQHPAPSPQKLQKSWTEGDVKDSDLVIFEIPFDDFRLPLMQQMVEKIKRHHKFVKKSFITCPQGTNAKGRRTFLLDMNVNILPRMQQTVQELVRLVKEHGEERIKLPIYLWKGRERADRSITNRNILEILEYIKMYLANHSAEESLMRGESDHHYYSHDLSNHLQRTNGEDAIQVVRLISEPMSNSTPSSPQIRKLEPDYYPDAPSVVSTLKPNGASDPRTLKKKIVSDNLYGVLSDEQRNDTIGSPRPYEANLEPFVRSPGDKKPSSDVNASPNEHLTME
jgi:hypothetical protein